MPSVPSGCRSLRQFSASPPAEPAAATRETCPVPEPHRSHKRRRKAHGRHGEPGCRHPRRKAGRRPLRRRPGNARRRQGLLVGRGPARRIRRVGLGVAGEPQRGHDGHDELGDRHGRVELPDRPARLPGVPAGPGLQSLRRHPSGQAHRPARVLHLGLARHDPLRGDGHRADQLRRGRADLPLRNPSARPRGSAHDGRRGPGDAVQLLRLGPARLGDLRGLRPRHRVVAAPQGPVRAHLADAAARPRPPRRRMVRQGRRHLRHHRHPLRHDDLARPRAPPRSTRA